VQDDVAMSPNSPRVSAASRPCWWCRRGSRRTRLSTSSRSRPPAPRRVLPPRRIHPTTSGSRRRWKRERRGSSPALAPCWASALSCDVMYEMAGRPRSIRSSLTTMNACSVTGRLFNVDSEMSRGSDALGRPGRVDRREEVGTAGETLAGGLPGGRMPCGSGRHGQPLPVAAAHKRAAMTRPPDVAATDRPTRLPALLPHPSSRGRPGGRVSRKGGLTPTLPATRLTQRVP